MKQLSIVFALLAGLLLGYLIATGTSGTDTPDDRKAETGAHDTRNLGSYVEDEYSRLVKEGLAENPDMPASVAAQKRARVVGAEQLAEAGSDSERNMIAAGQFWGFLYVNTRARSRYCDDVGVDITPFAEAFAKAHEREQAVAAHVFSEAGFRLEDHWESLEPAMLKAVRQDMSDIQKMNNLSAVDACRIFAEKPDALVENMLLRDKAPATYETLKKLADTP